ncbi:hypothetical protein ACL02R_13905 [Streptomyces sp. MS19]|uniref:hypothetical protein n=1 Tax=Streptomyces sp. MS19 TaxID=3385972 RepID=UPI0039A09FE1
MSLLPRCMYCGAVDGALVAVAAVAAGSGAGWTYHACEPCRVAARIVPLGAQPWTSWGEAHYWPRLVPDVLVARIAGLGTAELRAVSDRLFPALARAADDRVTAAEREAARAEADAAVADLWALARRGDVGP